MSFTLPGAAMPYPGTQPVDMPWLKNAVQTWGVNLNLGAASAPTYKSCNRAAAYFFFLKATMANFHQESHAFLSNPDSAKYTSHRKIMILLANILLRDYCSLTIGARKIDYNTVCRYDSQHEDLVKLVEGWAKEIDDTDWAQLTEIYVDIDGVKYPIAFYSTQDFVIFPFNTINPVVLSHLIGWDEARNDFTMASLLEALNEKPMSDRALYAALKDVSSGLTNNTVLDTFANWVRDNCADVTKPGGAPYSTQFNQIPIDDTVNVLTKLPIPKVPVIGSIMEDLFSEQLLIIKYNTNVKNQELGLSEVSNNSIGILDLDAPQHAVVAPLSEALIEVLRNPGENDTIRFCGCTVLREGGSYRVTIELAINGATYTFPKVYDSGDVKKCDNFPLISIMTQDKTAFNPARLYRTDYDTEINPSPVYLDGHDIQFGLSGDARELQFNDNTPVVENQLSYSSVGYHDPVAGRSFYCGYLLFDRDGSQSLYNKAMDSSKTAVIIDEENNVAQIAVLNTADMRSVTSYNVYNERILFFNTNKRDDLDLDLKGRSWGQQGITLFKVGDGRYALAPFSKEFAEMVAKGSVKIESAKLENNGEDWVFSVSFMFNGKRQQTAPRVYKPDDQFTMANPPFFFAVKTNDKETTVPGYEIIKVANMGMTTRTSALIKNGVDSNSLNFRIENKKFDTSYFTAADGEDVFIHVYNEEDYLGQITLNLNKYAQTGFRPLKDEHMNCAAIMLVKDKGMNRPKEIVTGTVFDDNLFLIVKESDREVYEEYKSWRATGFVVDIEGMTNEQAEGKQYQAVFPFSLKMLQNINNGSLQVSTPKVIFNPSDPNNQFYEVSVTIQITDDSNNTTFVPFSMKYELSQEKVVKCDNLPFVIMVEDKTQNKALVRFNNDSKTILRDHIDGSGLTIEVVDEQERKLNDGGALVPVPEKQVVLRLSALRNKTQASCHILYRSDDPFTDGVYSLQSKETGTQLVVDYNVENGRASKLDVFTDYVLYTLPMLRENEKRKVFAGNTPCTTAMPMGEGGMEEARIYSIPVTMSFTSLMERRGLKISSYTNVKFQNKKKDGTLSQFVIDDLQDLYVTVSLSGMSTKGGPVNITKVYPPERVIDFVAYELPTLTVFPYVNFVADEYFGNGMAGKPLWQQYNFAKFTNMVATAENAKEIRDREALGSRVDFWVNGQKIDFKERKSKLKQPIGEEKEMKVGTVTGWGRYIHMTYDGSAGVAAPQSIDTQLNGKEFGCIIMDPAEPVKVSAAVTATAGVDFGTRNSIIALQTGGDPLPSYPYHGNKTLQKVIIPNMFQEQFEQLSNYCYIPHFPGRPGTGGQGCGKFASSVMVYNNVINPNELVEPYDLGFVPNVQGDVLRKIMDGMGETGAGSMGTVLGYYTDLKISTDATGPKEALMKRNVRTFIKSIMFHTVLNAYGAGCGDITIRFSSPSKSYAADLGQVWQEALQYINRFIPEFARGNIHVGMCATEAKALFEYLKRNGTGTNSGMPKYSAITDGGDGTYDFTINKYDTLTNKLSTPNGGLFSLRYAGQQIVTDSINAFYDHLVARNGGQHNEQVRAKFRNMWKVDTENRYEMETLTEMVANLSRYREHGGQDHEMEKTLALMLIEQFGIDYNKISSANPKSLDDYINPEYVNFVRMIQYKFLFLFNVLGEQIRKTVDLGNELSSSFNVYLYGGTAQALLIAEPLCKGNLNVFRTHASRLPMAMFIDAMLDLPLNKSGAKYVVNFIPASDTEKLEIARGLISMEPQDMDTAGGDGGVVIPDFGVGGAAAEPAADSFGFMDNLFGGAPAQQAQGGSQLDADQPQTVEQFIDDLKDILENRTVKLPQGEVSIDFFLKFIDEKQQTVKLSEILDDPYIRTKIANDLTVMWDSVKAENKDIDDSRLLYHIYTLKMVGVVIESYLRK